MDWIEVAVSTTSDGVEAVTGRLYRLGITGTQIEDKREFADFLEHNRQYWDYVDEDFFSGLPQDVVVKAYVSDNDSGHEMLLAIRESMRALGALDTAHAFGTLKVSLTNRREEDWANNWKQYFKPLPVGERILIKPEWEPVPENANGRVIFEVNPGMTFGTGMHQTTQLCIELIEKYLKPGESVLDLGCGSGILSVIALLLGASEATAVDIDPNAADIARENARRNGIEPGRLTALTGDLTSDPRLAARLGAGRYRMVFANIVADVILALLDGVKTQMAPGGIFLVSGIIRQREREVLDAMEQKGYQILEHREKDSWVAAAARL